MIVILMGTSGSGKSTVGLQLADRMKCAFYDGDDFHPASNVEKMRRGEPLTDEDREPWLDRLRQLIEERLRSAQSAVIACSALRRQYRKRLAPEDAQSRSQILLVYLKISIELARERVQARRGHYMPASLVESQFAVLEEPQNALIVDASQPVERLVEIIFDERQRRTRLGPTIEMR